MRSATATRSLGPPPTPTSATADVPSSDSCGMSPNVSYGSTTRMTSGDCLSEDTTSRTRSRYTASEVVAESEVNVTTSCSDPNELKWRSTSSSALLESVPGTEKLTPTRLFWKDGYIRADPTANTAQTANTIQRCRAINRPHRSPTPTRSVPVRSGVAVAVTTNHRESSTDRSCRSGRCDVVCALPE